MHEKSLTEGEYELNYQKDLIFLHTCISTIFTQKTCKFCLFVDFWQQYYKKLHMNLLSLASVNRINAKETMQDTFILYGCQLVIIYWLDDYTVVS